MSFIGHRFNGSRAFGVGKFQFVSVYIDEIVRNENGGDSYVVFGHNEKAFMSNIAFSSRGNVNSRQQKSVLGNDVKIDVFPGRGGIFADFDFAAIRSFRRYFVLYRIIYFFKQSLNGYVLVGHFESPVLKRYLDLRSVLQVIYVRADGAVPEIGNKRNRYYIAESRCVLRQKHCPVFGGFADRNAFSFVIEFGVNRDVFGRHCENV